MTKTDVSLLAAAVAAMTGVALASFSATVGPAGATTDGGARDVAPEGPPATVRIALYTVPPVDRAFVLWGRKSMGVIRGPRRPLILERPRDSGPLDLVVKVEGHLPVHTRVYTFTDSKLWLRLTPLADRRKLLGFRVEVPDAGTADGAAGDLRSPPDRRGH